MGFFMNEKTIEITITYKTVNMRNDLKTHVSVTSNEYNPTPFKTEYDRRTDTKQRHAHTTYHDNYTVTTIHAVDNNNSQYSLKILREDFLPLVGDTLKVCINDENEIIAYIPYKNAEPISVLKQHKFEPISYYKWSFIIHAFPLTAPFYAVASLMPTERFVDGKTKKTYFFAIFALLVIAIQIYSSYNLYKYGGDAFLNSMIGYLVSGGIFLAGMILFDLREYTSKSVYISKIKKMLHI
jgi:hypothetical protein